MASQPRTAEQAEARRQDIRTLLIASVASAVAAVVVSQFWFAGTWIAAALTPVLVALFREAIERPTAKIAERVTSDSTAVQPRVVMPPDEEPRVEPASMRVYGKAQPSRRRKIAIRAALITGLLGFVIAFSAITITDLVTGSSVGGGGERLTFGGGTKKDEPAEERQPAEEPQDQEAPPPEQQTQPDEEQQAPPEQTTPTQTAPPPTTPTTPQQQPPPGG